MRFLAAAILLSTVVSCGAPAEVPTSLPAESILPTYWAELHVVLAPGRTNGPNGEEAVGYYQSLGFSCPRESARRFIELHIEDGEVDWNDSEITEVDPSALEPDIKSQTVPIDGSGVWYSSGRALYGPE